MEPIVPVFAEFVFWVLLGSMEPNALPDLTADEMLDGLPAKCEVLAFADVRGASDGLAHVISRWTDPAFLLEVPDVTTGAAFVESRIAAVTSNAVAHMGFDPLTQLDSIAVCFNLGAGSGGIPEPHFTVVMRGDATVSDAMRTHAGVGLFPVPGYDAFRDEYAHTVLYFPEPGRVVWGWQGDVEPLFTAPAGPEPEPGSVNMRLAELAPSGVRRFLGYDPGLALSFLIAAFYPRSMAEHSAHLERGLVAADDTTIYLEATARTPDALADFALMLDGLGGLAVATPVVFESLTSLLLGSVRPGDPAYSPQVLALAEHRAEVLELLRTSGALESPELSETTDESTLTTTLTISNARGLQLLLSQIVLLGTLAAEGELPATVESFETIPRFWGGLLMGD